jgi:hypothetical protein
VAKVPEELAYVLHPSTGGGGGAEDLSSLAGAGCQRDVLAGAGHPRSEPDVRVDDIPVAPAAGIAFAPDQLLQFKFAD